MKRIILLLAFVVCAVSVSAQQSFKAGIFVSSAGDSLKYRYLEPEICKPSRKYPLVLFFHGYSDIGSDNERHLTRGSQMFLNPVNRERFPAFVIFPQCPSDQMWSYTQYPDKLTPYNLEPASELPPATKAVKELLDSYLDNPNVDKNRIYIMGISMGGQATFDMAVRFPEVFAAAVPLCGSVKAGRIHAAKNIKFRIYHGDADNVVPVECSRLAYRELKEAGAEVEYIELHGHRHDIWRQVFNQPDFMEWLFKQKRSRKH